MKMGDFISSQQVLIKKERQCLTCLRHFQIGSKMLKSNNKDDGRMYSIYICQTCQSLHHEFTALFEGSEWLYERGNVADKVAESPEKELEFLRNNKK